VKKNRLGADPLEDYIRDTREEKPGQEKPVIKPRERKAREPERYQKIRAAIKEGKTSNYYLNKKDELMTKLLIHLPLEVHDQLQKRSNENFPKVSMSQILVKLISGYLKSE